MILLDIITNISDDLLPDSNCESENKKYITLKFKNNYNDNNENNLLDDLLNDANPYKIIGKRLKKGETIDIRCKICCFLGSGSSFRGSLISSFFNIMH